MKDQHLKLQITEERFLHIIHAVFGEAVPKDIDLAGLEFKPSPDQHSFREGIVDILVLYDEDGD